MARFVLLRIDDNKQARKLSKKLAQREGVEVVGEFLALVKAQFCTCPPEVTHGERVTTGLNVKWGFTSCNFCKKPRPGNMHLLRNLLEPTYLDFRHRDLMLKVMGEYHNDPEEVYGKEEVEHGIKARGDTYRAIRSYNAEDGIKNTKAARARARREARRRRNATI